MRIAVTTVLLVVLLAVPASAEARLTAHSAHRYANEHLAVLVMLYENPTPTYTLGRCARLSGQRFRCPFVVRYQFGDKLRTHIDVVRRKRVPRGFTRMGWRLPRIPEPPKSALRRGLADYS